MTDKSKQSIVPVMLNGGRVTLGFREALFAAAARAGTSVNEFVLRAAGQQLIANGFDVDGVFNSGDLGRSLALSGMGSTGDNLNGNTLKGN